MKVTLLILSGTPVDIIELDPKCVAVVLAVGNGGWPELMTGVIGACVPVPRLPLLPGGMPWLEEAPGEAVGPILPVVFEIGNGVVIKGVLVAPPALLLLPLEATIDEVPVAAEPVPAELVGLGLPVEFESGNGASDALLCND